MYLPVADIEISIWILLTIGFFVGVLGGFFGIGGAFMVTPALNIFGFPMAYAIGTDLAHIMGKSIVATFKHRKMGNVDLRLGVIMLIGTAAGVETGKEVVLYLERIGIVETVVRIIYIALLVGVGSYMMYDYLRFAREHEIGEKKDVGERIGTVVSKKIHDINIPPMVTLPESQIKSISIWAIIIVGFLTGFLTAFLGVGGGFIRMPALIYGLGVPTTVAIGTDLFEIIFSAGIGAFLYALEGKVEIVAAAVMLLGAAIGAQIGATATAYVKGMKIRFYFALTVFLAGISVLIKQFSVLYAAPFLGTVAGYLIIGVSGAMTLIVMANMASGIIEERRRAPKIKRARKVLAATGGSTFALNAIRAAGRISRGIGAKVTLLTVEDPHERVDTKKALSDGIGVLEEMGVETRTKIVKGDVAKKILKEAKGYELLVIGSHGLTNIKERLLGAKADHIAGNPVTSTLVVRGEGRISKILLGVIVPGYSKKVVDTAAEIAGITNSKIEILSVMPSPRMYPFDTKREWKSGVLLDNHPEEAAALEEIRRTIMDRGIEARCKMRAGLTEEEILKEAYEGGHDLIVIGASRRRGIIWRMIGDLSYDIVKHAETSVLVVHSSSRSNFGIKKSFL